jgi:DNA primase
MDAIVLAGEMGLCAVGYPGTNNWRAEFTRAIGPDWPRIVVVCDGDEPGRMAGKKVAKELHAETVILPDGHDVSSIYVSKGKRGLAAVLGLDEMDAGVDPYPLEPSF